MNLWKTCLMFGAVLAALVAHARPVDGPPQAGVRLASRSIRLDQAGSASNVFVVFSRSGAGARAFGDGELRPSLVRPGFYEAAYAVFDSSGGTTRRVETGTIYVAIPDADADGDTLPDTADLSAAVDLILPGEAVTSSTSRESQAFFSFHLQRAADSETGTFTTDLLPDVDLGGAYSVLHAEGVVAYQRTERHARLDFQLSNATTNAHARARVLDTNTVRTAAFRLRVSPTRRIRVAPVLLTRTNNLYHGRTVLTDGRSDTRANDFRSWVLEMADKNDRNDNGVPDFSDVLPPRIVVQPRRAVSAPGGSARLSVVVAGQGPFTFVWEQNGADVSNPAADPGRRALLLPDLTDTDRGSYRVRVSNAGGSIFSDSTSVSFRE